MNLMSRIPRRWRRAFVGLVGGLAVPLALSLEAPAQKPETLPPPSAADPAPAAPAAVVLDLGAAVRLALERQPTLAAYRASLAAAEAQQRGLNELGAAAALAAGR